MQTVSELIAFHSYVDVAMHGHLKKLFCHFSKMTPTVMHFQMSQQKWPCHRAAPMSSQCNINIQSQSVKSPYLPNTLLVSLKPPPAPTQWV